MKSYDIWTRNNDGYESYHGKFRGCNFRDAVINFKCSNSNPDIRYNIDIDNLTFYGNKFYGKEEE